MLKTKLNVLTLRKEPLPTVIFHEPEAIELCSTTPLAKNRTHAGYKVGSHGPNNPPNPALCLNSKSLIALMHS